MDWSDGILSFCRSRQNFKRKKFQAVKHMLSVKAVLAVKLLKFIKIKREQKSRQADFPITFASIFK